MISWDQIYTLIEKNTSLINIEKRENILSILCRMRYEYFQKIYDDVISKLSRSINYTVSYPGQNAKDIYYSKHIILPVYPDITFSLGIFIKAPSYLLVNPFKIIVRGVKYDMNMGDPVVQSFKNKLRQLPGTKHELLAPMPGYMIDLFATSKNTSERIANEVVSILKEKPIGINGILSLL